MIGAGRPTEGRPCAESAGEVVGLEASQRRDERRRHVGTGGGREFLEHPLEHLLLLHEERIEHALDLRPVDAEPRGKVVDLVRHAPLVADVARERELEKVLIVRVDRSEPLLRQCVHELRCGDEVSEHPLGRRRPPG